MSVALSQEAIEEAPQRTAQAAVVTTDMHRVRELCSDILGSVMDRTLHAGPTVLKLREIKRCSSNGQVLILEDHPVRKFMAKYKITPAEFKVLRLLADGMSNGEIAAELICEERTIKFHLTSIFRKTGTKNRVQLAVMYVKAVG